MNIQDLFSQWNGKQNDNGQFPDQCVNIIKSYFTDVLNLPKFTGNAIDYWTHPPLGFQIIKNQPWNSPQLGDVVIWSTNLNPYGHVGICQSANVLNLTCFMQNWPIGSPCHFQKTGYKYVLGWLRPIVKQNLVSIPPKIDTKFTMQYTVFNTDPMLMEQARQLLVNYSNVLIDCAFTYKTIPTVKPSSSEWLTTDEDALFLKNNPVSTPFAFLSYVSTNTASAEMSTQGIAGSPVILTAATQGNTAFYVCYEFVNAIQEYCQKQGFQVTINDVFQPDEAFLKAKIATILPFIPKLN